MLMLPRLDSTQAYEAKLSLLARRWTARGRATTLEAYGVSLADIQGRYASLARVLTKVIRKNEFRFSPLTSASVRTDGKVRTIYRPNLLDALVLSVVADYLTAVSERYLSPALHSFRKGHSSTGVVRLVSQYFREHRASVPLKQRGLYVLQRDIAQYGESLDTSTNSALFDVVSRVVIDDPDPNHRELAQRLITEAIAQPVLGSNGTAKPLDRGVPTGSPIQIPCLNLYLADVDRQFESIAGAFYARFGDDILFMHPDPAICAWASAELESQMSRLKLNFKTEKSRSLYVNGAGRKSPVDATYKPVNTIEYLGLRVEFAGGLALKQIRQREFHGQLRERLASIRATAGTQAPLTLAQLMCGAAARALNPLNPVALTTAQRLTQAVDDRNHLRDLDYRIALMIAEAATGLRGPRAFRLVSYRALRRMGLPSLVVLRNRRAPEMNRNETH